MVPVLHRRKAKMMYRRGIRTTVLLFALLCLCVGGGMFIVQIQQSSDRLRAIPWIYVAIGVLLLIVDTAIDGMEKWKHWRRYRRRLHGPGSDGFALLLVLVLLFVLAALALHVHAFARMALRHARQRAQDAELRLAASDAAWQGIQSVARPPSGPGPSTTAASNGSRQTTPSGIDTDFSAVRTNASAFATVLPVAGAGRADTVYAVVGRAQRDDASCEVRAWIRRSPGTSAQILAWVEGE